MAPENSLGGLHVESQASIIGPIDAGPSIDSLDSGDVFGTPDVGGGTRRPGWWAGSEEGGHPRFIMWDGPAEVEIAALGNVYERNHFDGPGGERPNFPLERGFNAVVFDPFGYTMGARFNPLTGLSEEPPPQPEGSSFGNAPDAAASLVVDYIKTKVADGISVFVKLPVKEVQYAFLLLKAGLSMAEACSMIRRYLMLIWEGLSAEERPRFAGVYLDDEPEIVPRLPQPDAGETVEVAFPHVAGISCDSDLAQGATVTLRVHASNRPYTAEWDLGGAATFSSPADATSLTPSVVLGAAGTYSIKVRVRNQWGFSTYFELPAPADSLPSFTIGAPASHPTPVITGHSSHIGSSGIARRQSLRARHQIHTPVVGGSGQVVNLIAHVLGPIDSSTWEIVSGATDLGPPLPGESEGLSAAEKLAGRRVQLAEVVISGSQPGTPIPFIARVTVTGASASGSHQRSVSGEVAVDRVLFYKRYQSPEFLSLLGLQVYEFQRAIGITPTRPLMTTHSQCIIPRRYYGLDRRPATEAGCGFAMQDRNGQVQVDRLGTPHEWELPSDPNADAASTFPTAMHGFDEYPLKLQGDLHSDPLLKMEADELARKLLGAADPVPDAARRAIANQVFAEDFTRPLQHLEALQRGSVRTGRGNDPDRDFLTVPKTNSNPVLIQGLHQFQVLNQDNRVVWVTRPPIARTPVIQWLPGWGQPFEDAGNPLRDPGISVPPGLNVNEDSSIDPIGPGSLDPNFRFLRKPAMDDPTGTPADFRSKEARRLVWHAFASGCHGFGLFAQFYVSDSIIARVWSPIIWEIMHYHDLKWNSEILSAPERALSDNRVTWNATRLDDSPDGPLSPMPNDLAWLPPRVGLLKRIRQTTYADYTQTPTAITTREADQIVLLLFNRSHEDVSFHLNMNLRFETDPLRGALGRVWREFRYRDAFGSSVSPLNRMRFDVEPYDVQIWHLV